MPAVFASLEWYLEVADTITAIYRQELLRDPEPEGLYNWLYHAREHPEYANAQWILDQVKASPEWHAIHDHPAPAPMPPLPPFPSGDFDRVLPWALPNSRDFIRADAWGVPISGLPFVSGGSSEHPERLLTPFIYKYDKALWARCFDEHRRRGYSHWILWWPNFRADGGTIAQFVDLCKDVQAAGFYTQVGLNSKDFDPRDLSAAQWITRLDPLFNALNAVKAADEYAVWEWDSHNIPGQPTIDSFKHFGRRAHEAGASFWIHFFPEHTSWFADGDPRGRFGFYDDLGTDVDGLQYQTQPTWTIQETQARLVDTLSQFGQQGNRHKLRFFEDQATLEFKHDHPDENDASLRGYLACCTIDNVAHTDSKIWGYGNGGRRPDGSRL
jgi:hypothetical protein